ncbi:MAG: hypothetical protein D6693_02315, partial [Planctomycetota bacterium]
MIRQTAAIFLDQYRELNSRKLFWIATGLSGLVVVAFALIGVADGQLTIAAWKTGIPADAIGLTREAVYKILFLQFGVGFWLAWLATILALVTTAGMIPDFITSGSIDLALSKPIGRVRLFLTKYAAGLLFVGLQVSVFSVASFFVLGLRGGAWEPAIFLAVPIVLVFFSYLFSVCVLLGLLTRSTIAALLLTLLFWFVLFALNATELSLIGFQRGAEQRVQRLEQRIDELRADAQRPPESMLDAAKQALAVSTPEDRIARLEAQLAEARDEAESLAFWHRPFYIAKTLLPKTSETIGLLRRALVELAELPEFGDTPPPAPAFTTEGMTDEERAEFESRMAESQNQGRLIAEELTSRSVAWVVGSSLA